MYPATIMTAKPQRIPGIYPPINSAATEIDPPTVEKTIRALLGGINIPVGADAMLTAAENSFEYPLSASIGPIVPPMAAAAAFPLPLIATKNMFARTLLSARAPGSLPHKASASLIILIAIPPLFIKLPARTKNGIARRGNEFKPVNIFCAQVTSATFVGRITTIAIAEDMPIATAIGAPINKIITSATTITIVAVIATSILFHLLSTFCFWLIQLFNQIIFIA